MKVSRVPVPFIKRDAFFGYLRSSIQHHAKLLAHNCNFRSLCPIKARSLSIQLDKIAVPVKIGVPCFFLTVPSTGEFYLAISLSVIFSLG